MNTLTSSQRLNIESVRCISDTDGIRRNNLDIIYERPSSDNISIIGQQYFVPISSSIIL